MQIREVGEEINAGGRIKENRRKREQVQGEERRKTY